MLGLRLVTPPEEHERIGPEQMDPLGNTRARQGEVGGTERLIEMTRPQQGASRAADLLEAILQITLPQRVGRRRRRQMFGYIERWLERLQRVGRLACGEQDAANLVLGDGQLALGVRVGRLVGDNRLLQIEAGLIARERRAVVLQLRLRIADTTVGKREIDFLLQRFGVT